MKQSYNTQYQACYQLGLLPITELSQIPRSTQFDWNHKNQQNQAGYEWIQQNQQAIDTIKQLMATQNLLKINIGLVKIIALAKALKNTKYELHTHVIHQNIVKLKTLFTLKHILKYLGLSLSQYTKLNTKKVCKASKSGDCLIKHPTQLVATEVNAIEEYCQATEYKYWSLASIYHKLKNDGKLFISKTTFYKYIGILNLKRKQSYSVRKNKTVGIRASKPLEILHIDTTILRLADNSKAFIHLVQDNFSRAILGVIVSQSCLDKKTFDNIKAVYEQYLKDKINIDPWLITDDGSENKGEVTAFLKTLSNPKLIHHIAQSVGFVFSNSMIEACNKHLKYQFLYHKHIPDFEHLLVIVKAAIEEYNNKPHDVLNGLSPIQVLEGALPKDVDFTIQMELAKTNRINANKATKLCCLA